MQQPTLDKFLKSFNKPQQQQQHQQVLKTTNNNHKRTLSIFEGSENKNKKLKIEQPEEIEDVKTKNFYFWPI